MINTYDLQTYKIIFDVTPAAVFAAEPFARNVYNIYENLVANNICLDDICVIEKYIGNGDVKESMWGLDSVDGIALDSIPVDRSLFGLIKIDADGSELNILRSGLALLADAR